MESMGAILFFVACAAFVAFFIWNLFRQVKDIDGEKERMRQLCESLGGELGENSLGFKLAYQSRQFEVYVASGGEASSDTLSV